MNLKAKSRNLYDFFDKLVLLGLLERKGIEETAYYKNSDSTNVLFVNESSENILSLHHLCVNFQKGFMHLEETLKNGYSGDFFSEKFYTNSESTMQFLASMKSVNEKKFDLSLKNIPSLKDFKTMIDFGGGLGILSKKVKEYYPDMICISMDLPLVNEFAKNYLKQEGYENKIQLISGDFFTDEWPKTDIVFIGNVLQDWEYEKKIYLLQQAYERLNEGGMFICIEEFIDDKREKYTQGLDLSINMIVFATGYNMTPSEFSALLYQIGFKNIQFFTNGVDFCIASK